MITIGGYASIDHTVLIGGGILIWYYEDDKIKTRIL